MNENTDNQIQNSTETQIKRGRGRTKGSYSFITVSGDVISRFPNVVVSRKWAEAVGIGNDVVAKNSLETLKQTTIATAEAETPVQVTIED